MTQVQVTLAEEDLGVFDTEKLTIFEAIQLEGKTGLKLREFAMGVDEGSPRALQALVWVLKTRRGDVVPDPHSINFAYGDFDMRILDEPDPTVPSSGTDGPGTSDS